MKCDGLGMPLLTDNGTIYGNLLINFDIIFPYRLKGEQKDVLRKVFDLKNIYSDKSTHNIEYYKSIDELNNERDEEDMPQGVQCAQQ